MKLTFSGGINENDETVIQPDECISGFNFELGFGDSHKSPRPPVDLKGIAPNSVETTGILQLVRRDDTETTLSVNGAKAYLWDGSSSYTEQGTDFFNAGSLPRAVSWDLDQYIVISDLNKLTPLSQWDGTTLITQPHNISGVTDLYASYAIEHLNRIWLFNIRADTSELPHVILASDFETPTIFNTGARGTAQDPNSVVTENDAFFLTVPDLRWINGVVLFNKQLVISTRLGRLYKLVGTDSTNFNFVDYYAASDATGVESIANIGNDVAYMKRGGNIERLSDTQRSGDVDTDDISRFIKTSVKNLQDSITVYDQKNQKVFFFVKDKILVFFKDMIGRGGEGGQYSPWSIYETDSANLDASAFNFNTKVAVYIRIPGTKIYSVYFGDPDGGIRDLNGILDGDNGALIRVERTSRLFELGKKKNSVTGRIQYRRKLKTDLSIFFDYAETYGLTNVVVPLKGPTSGGDYYNTDSFYNADNYYNTRVLGGEDIATVGFSPSGSGTAVRIITQLSVLNDFQIDQIDL